MRLGVVMACKTVKMAQMKNLVLLILVALMNSGVWLKVVVCQDTLVVTILPIVLMAQMKVAALPTLLPQVWLFPLLLANEMNLGALGGAVYPSTSCVMVR